MREWCPIYSDEHGRHDGKKREKNTENKKRRARQTDTSVKTRRMLTYLWNRKLGQVFQLG
jgi:hypothetical protein